jgi:hypothetical protein
MHSILLIPFKSLRSLAFGRRLGLSLALLILAQLGGCAWFSSAKEWAFPSGANTQYAAASELELLAPPPPADFATVYFYRVGLHPASDTPDVLLAGKYVYRAKEGFYTFAHVRSGYKKFRVQWEEKAKIPAKEWVERIEPGKIYYFKIGGIYASNHEVLGKASGARLTLSLDDKWQMSEMKNCCRTYSKPQFPDYE